MAAITNPQAVAFCNNKARRLADLIESCRRTCEQFAIDIAAEFEANTGGNADGDTVSDGAATDGRQVITKLNIAGLKFVAAALATSLNTDDRATLVANVSVNGAPLF